MTSWLKLLPIINLNLYPWCVKLYKQCITCCFSKTCTNSALQDCLSSNRSQCLWHLSHLHRCTASPDRACTVKSRKDSLPSKMPTLGVRYSHRWATFVFDVFEPFSNLARCPLFPAWNNSCAHARDRYSTDQNAYRICPRIYRIERAAMIWWWKTLARNVRASRTPG